jgi:DNA replication and repair protein RecF
MPIKTIELVSFRNHERSRFNFGDQVNLIWGENGSGKTSVLEAVHILSMGRSFRTKRLDRTIREGDENLYIHGVFESKGVEKEVSFGLGRDGRRKLVLDGSRLTGIKGLIGVNPVVILSPEEQVITFGGPADRRAYFDRVFSTVSKPYLESLSSYTKTLKHRNAALRNHPLETQSVEAWNEPLVQYGVHLWEWRKEYFDMFNKELTAVTGDFSESSIRLDVKQNTDNMLEKEWFSEQLKRNLAKDQRLGWTSVGPHRDEPVFLFNDQPLKEFGSQGEHKLSLVLLKLAEFGFIYGGTGICPTLLLDDLFAKLDLSRGEAVMELLNRKAQTLITNTNLVGMQQYGIEIEENSIKTFHLAR